MRQPTFASPPAGYVRDGGFFCVVCHNRYGRGGEDSPLFYDGPMGNPDTQSNLRACDSWWCEYCGADGTPHYGCV